MKKNISKDSIIKYRWECIRRNKDYQKFFNQYKNWCSKMRIEFKKRKRNFRNFINQYGSCMPFLAFDSVDLKNYMELFNVIPPQDPKKEYQEIARQCHFLQYLKLQNTNNFSLVDPARLITENPCQKWDKKEEAKDLMGVFKSKGRKAFEEYYGSDKFKKILKKIKANNKRRFSIMLKKSKFSDEDMLPIITIDLNLNRRKPDILKEVGRIIDKWNDLRQKAGLLRDKRVEFKKYDEYFEIYDLRQKGWKYIAIAQKKFGSVSDGNVQRAKRGYRQACKLINGGWVQIR